MTPAKYRSVIEGDGYLKRCSCLYSCFHNLFLSAPLKMSVTLFEAFEKMGKKQNKEQVPPPAEPEKKKPSSSKQSKKSQPSTTVSQPTHKTLEEAFKAVSNSFIFWLYVKLHGCWGLEFCLESACWRLNHAQSLNRIPLIVTPNDTFNLRLKPNIYKFLLWLSNFLITASDWKV